MAAKSVNARVAVLTLPTPYFGAAVIYCTITIWNVRPNQFIGKRGLNLRYIMPSAVL